MHNQVVDEGFEIMKLCLELKQGSIRKKKKKEEESDVKLGMKL